MDNDMIFNKETKRFYLTEDYVYNKLGTDLSIVAFDELDTNLSTLNERLIEYACDILYDYIEEYSVYPESALYHFYVNKDAYNALKKALGYQLLKFVQYGENSNDGDKNESVSKRAIKCLDAKNVFYVRYVTIPPIEEW